MGRGRYGRSATEPGGSETGDWTWRNGGKRWRTAVSLSASLDRVPMDVQGVLPAEVGDKVWKGKTFVTHWR